MVGLQQMSTSNQIALQNQSSDIYESISSEQGHQQHPHDYSQNYRSQSIVFPAKPKHYDHLIQIYQQNRHKLQKLSSEVHELQAIKIKKLRLLKNDKTEDDFAFQQIINSDVSKIDYYKERRLVREKELKNLKQLYNKLNQINQKEAYLLNQSHMKRAMAIIERHKQVINYKIAKNNLLVFSKQFQSHDLQIVDNPEGLAKSNILLQNQVQQFYTVAIFELQSLIHWMKPKDVNFQLEQRQNIKVLIAWKEQAQKDMINVRSTNIRSPYSLVFLNYSSQFELIFLQKNDGTVVVYDFEGCIKSEIRQDKIQEVTALQVIKNEVYIATKQGVIRIYSLSISRQIILTGITRCCSAAVDRIDRMAFEQSKVDVGVVYTIKDKVFEYNVISSQIIQRDPLQQSKIKVTNSLLDTYLKKTFTSLKEGQIQKIDKCLNLKSLDKHVQLLHIQSSKKEKSEQHDLKLLLGDRKGNLSLIFCETA